MTLFNVHLYREMRLTFGGIEADSPLAASTIASTKATSDADGIDDCDGDNLAALVDVAGDTDFGQSVTIDFEAERLRQAASQLLASLEAILPYAESEAHCLERLKDSPEAEVQAEAAWIAVEAAQRLIAELKGARAASGVQD